jgi:hypothetical protein
MAPVIKLSSGHDMPQVGFGLWKVDNAVASDVVYNAIKAGYRLFDGACGKSPLSALSSPHSIPSSIPPREEKAAVWPDTMTSCARCPTWRGRRGREGRWGKNTPPPPSPSPPPPGRQNGGVEFCRIPVSCRGVPLGCTQYTGRDGTGRDGAWICCSYQSNG